jgi:hypothetical protein
MAGKIFGHCPGVLSSGKRGLAQQSSTRVLRRPGPRPPSRVSALGRGQRPASFAESYPTSLGRPGDCSTLPTPAIRIDTGTTSPDEAERQIAPHLHDIA